jgi:hypothetical protein
MDKEYQGQVFLSEYITSLQENFEELNTLIDNFKKYWRTGYHHDFGKDVPFHDPSNIRKSSVRHVHLIPIAITADDERRWLNPFSQIDHTKRPASNRWLAYCVGDNRDCCLLAYLKDNAHFLARQGHIVGLLIDSAEAFFDDLGIYPLDEYEQSSLFEDKWHKPLPSIQVIK